LVKKFSDLCELCASSAVNTSSQKTQNNQKGYDSTWSDTGYSVQAFCKAA